MPAFSISWSGDGQAEQLFDALQGIEDFSVEVVPQDQIDAWNQILEGTETEETVPAVGGEEDLTLALLEKAADARILLGLVALLFFAAARGFTVTFHRTKTTTKFFMKMGEQDRFLQGSEPSISLPDFGKLSTALEGLGQGVTHLQPEVTNLESQAAGVQQQAPAASSSLNQDLSNFSDILGDVVQVVQLLAKIKILEGVFDFTDIATQLGKIQSQIKSLETQASDLDHEVATVNTLLGQLNDPSQQLSQELAALQKQITSSWEPAYAAVPKDFQLAEQANQKANGKFTSDIQAAATVYTNLLGDIEPVLADMTTAVGNATTALPKVQGALQTLGASNSSLDRTRGLLSKADSLLQAVDSAKSQFDIVAQMVQPLEGLLGALNVLVSGGQKLNPANPSTKKEIDQAISAILPIQDLLDDVESTANDLKTDVDALQGGIKTFSAAASDLLKGAATVSNSIQLSDAAQKTLQKLAHEVSKSTAQPALERLVAGEPGPVRDWTAAALRHAAEVLNRYGNSWLEVGRDQWSAEVAGSSFHGTLEASGVGDWANGDSLAALTSAIAAARKSGAYADPFTVAGG